MKVLFVAAWLAVPGAARAQTVGDPAFFLQLGLAAEALRADIRGSDLARARAGELGHEDAVRLVLEHLHGSGVPESFVRTAFDDPATRIYPDIPPRFKPGGPVEEAPYDRYRKFFITEERIKAGAAFAKTHAALLSEVERRTGVDAAILVALVGVETFYGTKTGTYPVFSALYTITLKVPARTKWASRELAEWLVLCRKNAVAPHSVKGSYAGAFGYFQFIPSSFNRLAVDFDGDGRVAFDEWPDVLGSVGNYLKRSGWQPGGSLEKPAKNYWAIYAYNRSDNYVRVVVELRGEILKRLAPSARRLDLG